MAKAIKDNIKLRVLLVTPILWKPLWLLMRVKITLEWSWVGDANPQIYNRQ